MARNIEIKARIDDINLLESQVAKVADRGPTEIFQDDTFFQCDAGRLKLRVLSETHGELIFYRRDHQAGPKESFYVRSQTGVPETLRETLVLAYGVVGHVRKHRTLYLVDRTRIHLDRVEALGHFLELEVMLSSGESSQVGVEIAHHLLSLLDIDSSSLIEEAYVDLIERKGS